MNFKNIIKTCLAVVFAAYADPVSVIVNKDSNKPIFRTKFNLNLNLDKGQFFQEQIDSVPYVYNDNVYLFNNDVFGVKLTLNRDSSFSLLYESDTSKSDVVLSFKQDPDYGSKYGMILAITNKTNYSLHLSAAMNIPNQRKLVRTSILPIKPKLKNFESWPHPIRELILIEWNAKIAP